MPYFDILEENQRKSFDDFYQKNPQLLKKHEKKYKAGGNDIPQTAMANNFIPNDLNEWFLSLGKLYKYEKKLYCKVDKHGDFIILSWYWLANEPHIQKRTVFLMNDGEVVSNATYVKKRVGTSPYMLLMASSDYHMGGWTDYDFLYKTYQRKITTKEQAVLKEVKALKYLPFDKFDKINAYLLLDRSSNQNWLYQIEILYKMGLKKLATDIHFDGREVAIDNFKRFKREINNGIRLEQLKQLIHAELRKEEEKKWKEAVKNFEFSKKIYYIGNYILRYPKNFDELAEEGRKLMHCVSSYKNRIANKQTEVLFLRKKNNPDEPFYTVEYNKGKVIQVRTFNNKTDREITKLVEDTLYGDLDRIIA